jgi:hypothetical protein
VQVVTVPVAGPNPISASTNLTPVSTAFAQVENIAPPTAMANKSGKGAQSLTSEYEIMRGDLVRILYGATKDNVEYIFGRTVERFEQDEKHVVAHFSDGSSDTFDLLSERTARRRAFGKPFCHLTLPIVTGGWGYTLPIFSSRARRRTTTSAGRTTALEAG